jgi:hypothetical protein
MVINLSKNEIKALIIASIELNEKITFVDKIFYEDYKLGFKSNEEIIEANISAEEKLRGILI